MCTASSLRTRERADAPVPFLWELSERAVGSLQKAPNINYRLQSVVVFPLTIHVLFEHLTFTAPRRLRRAFTESIER